MTTTRSITLALLVAAGGLAVPACSTDDSSQSTLTVDNRSDFVIEQIYITDTNASGWGPNLISPDALFPGEQVVIDGIECGTYDTLLVDETGLECQLLGIDLCFDDATWVITNNTCDVFAAAAQKNAAQPQSSAPGAVN